VTLSVDQQSGSLGASPQSRAQLSQAVDAAALLHHLVYFHHEFACAGLVADGRFLSVQLHVLIVLNLSGEVNELNDVRVRVVLGVAVRYLVVLESELLNWHPVVLHGLGHE
jgi:hypothetical protein